MYKENLIVYETPWIIEEIYRTSDRIRGDVSNTASFEDRAVKRVAGYLNNGGSTSHRRYIIRLINEAASAAISSNRREYAILFIDLIQEDDDGEELDFEAMDEYTFERGFCESLTESDALVKEMVALLAQDDRRNVILESWLNGNDNNSCISELLAQLFGGNKESHRRFITRYRDECRERLERLSAV